MNAKLLYVNFSRKDGDGQLWRTDSVLSSAELDHTLCAKADLVIRYDHGRFMVIKDSYQLAGTVPLKGVDFT